MVENAVIMKYSLRPSLIIDPQDQAIDWNKNMLSDSENVNPPTENTEGEASPYHAAPYPGFTGAPAKKRALVNNISDRKFYEITTPMNAYLSNMTKAMKENKTVIINNIGEF
jgi:hypothetical protein